MIIDFLCRKARQRLIVFVVQVRFVKLLPVNDHLTVSHLDGFAGQADHAFYIAFVRFLRIPEDDDVTARDVAPAYALDLVINELVYKKAFAVMQFGHHRRTFNHYGLNNKHAKEDENHQNEKDVTEQPQALSKETIARFATHPRDLNVRIIARGDEAEIKLIFLAEVEHIQGVSMPSEHLPVGRSADRQLNNQL